MRVNKNQFAYLVALISEAEIFKKANGSKQFPIGLHLAIVLYRLGSSGESASIRKVAATFGIGDGATLMKITQRIFSVFITLLTKYIVWPSSSEQEQIISDTYNELPFCIGYIDGTEIKIADAPQINHEKYFSRNHIYSIKLQAVCDYKLRIRDVVVGYAGSTHDAKVFSNSILLKEKDRFFSNQSWIAGDSAYPLSDIIIPPYRRNSQQLTSEERIQFNKRHSKYRVRVEHCFGLLKENFCSLKELRVRIKNNKSHKFCCERILVCCILHNILLTEFESQSREEIHISAEEDLPDMLLYNNESSAYESKRKSIYNLMFN
ncbi:protein ALP1-like [Teleopsis dalmanni]|uniref:protein ALP1-like n=1 Tax=Teleopsis dalmanni TaxID=139649 RepID=UPI0018CE2EC0|nr:protein ALP1-like [Teleopsis dalmanni]